MRAIPLLRTILIVVACFGQASCYVDHRKDIAFQTLFSDKGWPDAEAFTQALSAKFPPGSSIKSLESFVTANHGACNEREPGHVWCEITTQTTFCAASMLGIEVILQSESIGTLKVIAGGLGC